MVMAVSMWHLVKTFWEIAVYAYGNASKLESQDVSKEILSTAQKSDENIPSRFWVVEIFHS